MSITDWKDLTNIAFFLVGGTIATLTYLQARRTIFSPLKTEIFKSQLKAIEEVVAFFRASPGERVEDLLGLEEILDLNASRMTDAFVLAIHPEKVRPLDDRYDTAVGMVLKRERADKYLRKVDEDNSDDTSPVGEWADWELPGVEFTQTYADYRGRLALLASSPYLPEAIRIPLDAFAAACQSAVGKIGDAVEIAARDMEIRYPEPEDVARISYAWVWNIYAELMPQMDDLADDVMRAVNEYLDFDGALNLRGRGQSKTQEPKAPDAA
ncbi:hypothetical protein [Stenotrophomonas lactitubi]|uniref:hypothetical protein n=1 Tax=Stenotrophomonas lactitubi TaxID=2045214 RepID=UPI001DCE33A6|nr:hypothetical protein [Stenotrophomonas lactitubi]CAH0138586.1 hypothetical protein SRABI122_00408 [Stenotrophomonas lactitubi]CAH0153911.1 hypothetical protein SRABI66_00784 [Stenotrophomonas lactitubi]CAH0170858.1 hypothetical protein SRABI81_01208 [Stenotrophomonas lactitubi]CAH0205604.1 hypothetical protein SRABI102_01885 [Stenotrophomonas lactitubi]